MVLEFNYLNLTILNKGNQAIRMVAFEVFAEISIHAVHSARER